MSMKGKLLPDFKENYSMMIFYFSSTELNEDDLNLTKHRFHYFELVNVSVASKVIFFRLWPQVLEEPEVRQEAQPEHAPDREEDGRQVDHLQLVWQKLKFNFCAKMLNLVCAP